MEPTLTTSNPLALQQAAAHILRDLCIGAGAVCMALGFPTLLAIAIEFSAGSGVDTTRALRQEVAALSTDESPERKLRKSLDPGRLNRVFCTIELTRECGVLPRSAG